MGLLRELTSRNGFEARLNARGERFSVWIGQITARQQREWERHLAAVLDAFRAGGTVDSVTLAFFDNAPPRIREKLESWGMIPPSKRRSVTKEQRTIGGWTELCISELCKTDRTKSNYNQARDWLLKSVSESKDLASITVGELKRWQESMANALAVTTRNKHVKRVKTMLTRAVDDGLIQSNPANGLKLEREERVDRSRQQFIDAIKTKRVMDSLPNTNWRLLFALMRFQGLRRHEVFALDWHNINWQTNELTVPADTKTGTRTMPIFPEVLELLRDQSEIVSPGGKVIVWNRSEESLTELLSRRVKNALGECWPKPCHQLRSTRRTELDREFPRHVVNEWLGHSSEVAEKHYQQITAEDLAKASRLITICTPASTPEQHRNSEKPQETEAEDCILSGELLEVGNPAGGARAFALLF